MILDQFMSMGEHIGSPMRLCIFGIILKNRILVYSLLKFEELVKFCWSSVDNLAELAFGECGFASLFVEDVR